MIRDIVILNKSGISLFSQNFGECHSFGEDPHLFAGFISAIYSFSESINSGGISKIDLSGDKRILFQKNDKRIYTIICDSTDDIQAMEVKAEKISEIFENEYKEELERFEGDISYFEGFGNLLLDLKITQKNCGGRPECDGCPNSTKSLPLDNITNKLKEEASLWQKIKSKFQ